MRVKFITPDFWNLKRHVMRRHRPEYNVLLRLARKNLSMQADIWKFKPIESSLFDDFNKAVRLKAERKNLDSNVKQKVRYISPTHGSDSDGSCIHILDLIKNIFKGNKVKRASDEVARDSTEQSEGASETRRLPRLAKTIAELQQLEVSSNF